jgi:two-component system cell cycle sensor histidine kinase/response regulator CckA
MISSQHVDPQRVAVEVLDSLLEGCQVIDREFRYVFVNSTVAQQGKRSKEELLGRTMMECYPGIENTPMFAMLRACMTACVHDVLENEFTYPDGSRGWFELRFVPVTVGVCILSMDITTRKRTEEQLRQSQKMDAIGRLAGGVAHDFNNMLSVMLSYATLARGELTSNPSEADADILEIEKAGRRAAELTKKLLQVSRQQPTKPRILDLNESIAEMDAMFRRVLGANIELRTLRSESLASIKADSSQIEQIILNLVVNARDAMPDGGTLTIETANVDLDGDYVHEHLGALEGPHVMLAVSDSGIGMDKETIAKIFEPFFTTKPAGKGTGIGLATVYGIVQQSGGSIWVYSEPGQGSTFKVYFPVAVATVEHVVPVTAKPAAVPRRETILVAEDDDQLRKLIAGILERSGYRVLSAANAAEAEAIAMDGEKIHLLLTDLMMPSTNGRDLATKLQLARPGLRVLYMSGFTSDVAQQHGLENGAAFVPKPITPRALTKAVVAALA